MKRYLSGLFTFLISGAMIASMMFVTASGNFDDSQMTIEKNTSAKVVNYEQAGELSISKLEVNKIFGKFAANNPTKNPPTEPTSGTNAPVTVSADASTADPSTQKPTTSASTTTTVKAPIDDSKNIEYIKDPDYKSKYYIVVYTGSQSAVVYGKDDTGAYNIKIKAFTVSTGRIGSTPTRKGVYRIRAKYRWRELMGPCYGQWCSSISPSYLFHSVPYDKKRPDSLYNASYNNLGKAVSHGCIRMCVRDCKWIYDNCPIGTQVHVVWTSGPAGEGVPKRKSGSKYSGWDPSDKWSEGNPYFTEETTASSSTTSKTSASTTVTTTVTTTTTTTTSNTTTATTSAPPVSSAIVPDESSDDLDEVPVG